MATKVHALKFKIIAECSTTKARVGIMTLPHSIVDTPVFMPVGTQGTLKAVLPEQLKELDCRIMLSNTYHLGHRPVTPISYIYFLCVLNYCLKLSITFISKDNTLNGMPFL